jgi:iron-sulfur cluster insertion protein
VSNLTAASDSTATHPTQPLGDPQTAAPANAGVSTYTPNLLQVTESALAKVQALTVEEDNPALFLRVYVTGGGCSGFQYGFSFDEALNDDDTVIEKNGVRVVMDAMSYPYLVGARVDYQEGLQGARFTIDNPNASSTCGCGSSFSI